MRPKEDNLTKIILQLLSNHKNDGHDIDLYRKEFIEINEMKLKYRLEALKFLNKISKNIK